MSTNDHRTPGAPITGALVGAAAIGYMFPALAGQWRALRAPLGAGSEAA